MKAIIYEDVNKYKVIKDLEEPKINNQLNVKIKVLYCGICGSDIHKLLFEKPNKDYVKTKVLGHEITGIVVDKMKNVRDIQIGDRVVVEPLLYCNNCDMCKKGYIQFCENLKSLGKDFQGGFAEYLVANEHQLYKINKNVDTKIATLSDPYSVAMHIVNMIQKKYNGKTNIKIAIIGDGIIGMSCAELLLNKENEVIVFGKHNNRASILKNTNTSYEDIKNINKYLNYFDMIIEAVGGRQSETLNYAINISNKKGIIYVAGVYDNNFVFDISFRNAFYKELSIIGCNSFEKEGNTSDFKQALNFLSNNSIIANDLISKIYDISDFPEAIEYIKNREKNECIKVMIKM